MLPSAFTARHRIIFFRGDNAFSAWHALPYQNRKPRVRREHSSISFSTKFPAFLQSIASVDRLSRSRRTRVAWGDLDRDLFYR
jgi:hypothetical protein